MSLPTRERGLKRRLRRAFLDIHYVAPYAGAWIETSVRTIIICKAPQSLPTRERGLKLDVKDAIDHENKVAPYAGAWIETSRRVWT